MGWASIGRSIIMSILGMTDTGDECPTPCGHGGPRTETGRETMHGHMAHCAMAAIHACCAVCVFLYTTCLHFHEYSSRFVL